MTAPNRSTKHRAHFTYNNLEPRQLLASAADLLVPALPVSGYLLDDVTQESVARDYLASNPVTANLDTKFSDLKLVEIQHGLASTVTRFQQTIHGFPVADAYVTTIQGPTGEFLLVHNQSFEGEFVDAIPKKIIGMAAAEQIAFDHAGAISKFAPSRGELVWLPGQNKIAEQAWQITVFGVTAETHGDFLSFIDPISGKVLSQENRISHFTTGTGDVFYPNPWQTQGSGTGLTDSNDADSIALTNQLINVTLEGLDEGTGLLTGEFVDLATLNSSSLTDNDANESSREYNYTRNDARFEQVVIYHTVDQINRYFHTLGFDDDTGASNGIRDFPTLANAHWFTDDQSFYSTGDDAIHFGDGGVDDGEDGDIIAHEYGHAIQHDQNAAWGGGEMGAMGEGFGDYLAASFFQTHGDPTFLSSHAAAVGEWDATSYSSDDPPNLRRVDGNKTYPGGLTGQVHADGEIWSRALWDINQALGASIADQVILESHFLLPGSSSMVTAAEMVLLADQNLNGGAYAAAIRQAFEDRGILEPPETIGVVMLDKSFYTVGDVISITVTDGNGPAMIPVTITSSNGDSESLTLTGNAGVYMGTITSVAGTPTSADGLLQAAIGDTFTVTYEDTDDGTGSPVTATDTASFANVKQYVATDIPISITDNNTIQSTITVADVGDLADIDLQLNITHTYDGDLTGVLTAPNGEEITLFARIGGGGDNYTDTLFNDDASQAITDGSPPYSGEFRPAESFAALSGISITGNWTLSITDSASADTGTLNSWSLFIVANPKSPVGTVTLDKSLYEVGDVVSITVGDGNGPATVPVTITSSNGDSETLILTGDQGRYTGTLTSVAGSPTASDGQLQAASGDTFTVTYIDTDDGTGNPVTATATGEFIEFTQYTAGDVPIDITDNNTINSTINITDTAELANIDLQLDITHTWDGDLTGVLTAPNGEQITLFDRIGGSGDDYDNTRFDDDAGQLISEGSPPYSGVYRPSESFAALDGISITGDWVLSITDAAGGDTGSLNSWSLFIVAEPNPPIGPVTDADSGSDEVVENALIGATVGITGQAADPGDTVTYDLTNDAGGLFDIHTMSGVVTVAGSLDFETTSSHLIEIEATSSDGTTSTSQFTVGVLNAPEVEVSQVGDGSTQRSTVDQLVVRFDGEVNIASGAFSVVQRSDSGGATGTTIQTAFTANVVGGKTVVTITFLSGTRNNVGAIDDGNYELTIDHTKITFSGSSIAMQSDYAFGDNAADKFFAFFGDSDGDRTVGIADVTLFRKSFRAKLGDSYYDPSLDYDANGILELLDRVKFRENSGQTLNFV